jgi:SAM-dependent methyltransferase
VAYLFTHEDKKERERLAAIEAMGDPFTIECLEKIGVGEGWRCLEIGGGGGSITEWLSGRVGPGGKVIATDLQTKFLEAIEASNVEVRKHDITQDDLEQEAFDLVSARKVLEHLPEPSGALSRMAGAVRPGGWLLVEDSDLATRRHFSCPHPQRVERAYLKFIEAMSSAGYQPTYAKHLADELRERDFQDVQFVCPIPVGLAFPDELRVLGLEPSEQKHLPKKVEWNAASGQGVGKVYRMTFERLRDRVTKAGLLTTAEVDQFFADIQSPEFGAVTGFHCAAWGRKPE